MNYLILIVSISIFVIGFTSCNKDEGVVFTGYENVMLGKVCNYSDSSASRQTAETDYTYDVGDNLIEESVYQIIDSLVLTM